MSVFSEYKDFRYIYPPRPESAIPPDELDELPESEWIAQPKFNGSCAVVFINGKTNYKIYNRKGEPMKKQKPLNYNDLNNSGKYMVLCGEYLNMNKKGEDDNSFNHKFIIWDILVLEGRYLIGETLNTRLKILTELFVCSRALVRNGSLLMYEHVHTTRFENIFMAPSYIGNFKSLYYEIIQTELYEGLVLKQPSAKLQTGFKKINNSAWQVKVRRATESYAF